MKRLKKVSQTFSECFQTFAKRFETFTKRLTPSERSATPLCMPGLAKDCAKSPVFDLCFYIGCHGNKTTQSGCGNVLTLPSICRQEKSWLDTTLPVVVIKIHSKIHMGA